MPPSEKNQLPKRRNRPAQDIRRKSHDITENIEISEKQNSFRKGSRDETENNQPHQNIVTVIAEETIHFSVLFIQCVHHAEAVQRIERQKIEYTEAQRIGKQQLSEMKNKLVAIGYDRTVREKVFSNPKRNRTKQKSRNIIGNDARRARPKTTAAIMAEIIRIDGHGLRPAESRKSEHHDSERVEMFYGIERHSSVEFCRRIAAFIGYKRMRKLMQRNDDHNRKKTCEEIYYIVHIFIIPFFIRKSKCVKGFFKILYSRNVYLSVSERR